MAGRKKTVKVKGHKRRPPGGKAQSLVNEQNALIDKIIVFPS